jgi:Lysozyme like domain
MTQLAGSQVAELAQWAGLPTSQLVNAVAIAWAESGLRTDAVGENRDPTTHLVTSRDRGLWQINDYWHKDVSDACAFDKNCNASAMARISSYGSNWAPWSTWNSGAYKSYLTMSQLAVNYWLYGTAGVGGPTIGPGPTTSDSIAPNNNNADWQRALYEIRNGYSPIGATVRWLTRAVNEIMDAKYGPGNRFDTLTGGYIK